MMTCFYTSKPPNTFASTNSKQSGAVLIFSLLMLLVTLLIGLSLASLALIGEKSVRNQHDHDLALLAAEFALADAELDIENSDAAASRSAIFSAHSTAGFSAACGKGDANIFQGLCLPNNESQKPIWLAVDIEDSSADSASVQFGRFTGRTLPVGKGSLPAQAPRYIIELLLDRTPGQSAQTRYIYRITAIGFGTDSASQAVIQSFYRKSLHQEN